MFGHWGLSSFYSQLSYQLFKEICPGKDIAGVTIPPSSVLASHIERPNVPQAVIPVELAPKAIDPSDIKELLDRAINHSHAGDRFAKEMAFEQAETHYLSAYSLLNRVKSTSPEKVGPLLNQVLYKRGILYVEEGLYEAAKATFKELEENYSAEIPTSGKLLQKS